MTAVFASLFEKSPTAMLEEWAATLAASERKIHDHIRDIVCEQRVVERAIRESVARNDAFSTFLLGKDLLMSRRGVSRLYVDIAHLRSVGMRLSNHNTTRRVAGRFVGCTQVLAHMTSLVNRDVVREMSREMAKMGMLANVIEDVIDDKEDDEAHNEDVDAVLREVLGWSTSSKAEAEITLPSAPSKKSSLRADVYIDTSVRQEHAAIGVLE
jgi:hypothetical protein